MQVENIFDFELGDELICRIWQTFPLFPKRWELADVNFLVEFKQKTEC